jgi:hypothetical protein
VYLSYSVLIVLGMLDLDLVRPRCPLYGCKIRTASPPLLWALCFMSFWKYEINW